MGGMGMGGMGMGMGGWVEVGANVSANASSNASSNESWGYGGGMMGGGMMMNPCAAQGCVLCPPGTHDAGTCQPTVQNCGYNGMIGEMLEHVDHCGGNAMGNPALGGGNGMGVGYPGGGMYPGGMNMGGMGGMYPGGGMNMGGMGGMMNPCAAQ